VKVTVSSLFYAVFVMDLDLVTHAVHYELCIWPSLIGLVMMIP